MKLLVTLFLSLSLLGSAFGCAEDGSSGFLPKNSMRIPVGQKMLGGISETQFNGVIDEVVGEYAPIVAGLGGKLRVVRDWKNPEVNASAEQNGSDWVLNMYGGLARHSTITADGFALVVCHELGHHLGGAPKKPGRYASNEGQADYFATLKCLRRVWNSEDNSKVISTMTVPKILTNACGRKRANKEEKAICVRAGMAGMSVANLFASFEARVVPSFETPDKNIVTKTFDSHPAAQCRLDTYLHGSLCEKSFNEDVSSNEEVQGTCHASTGHKIGLRPKCWHKPAIN